MYVYPTPILPESDEMDWLFQFNPNRFDLANELERGVLDDEWSMNQGRQLVSPSDRVFFWQTGPEARLLAVGHVTSPVYERESAFGRYGVDIVFDYRIVPPLTKAEALGNQALSKFPPFKGMRGTNYVIRDSAIIEELDKALADRRRPISKNSEPNSTIEDSQKSLDIAIKRANQETANNIRDHIAHMDPTAFEYLVGALFQKLGYKNIEVTKRSGDGGVDVRATLSAGGVANIQTCIQVKRQKNVGRPLVQKLRGSLGAHQAGLLVISGVFTKEAIEEAKNQTRVPIALINGTQLTQLLLDHEIGVKHVKKTLYLLRLGDLSLENLQPHFEEQSGVEESDDSEF